MRPRQPGHHDVEVGVDVLAFARHRLGRRIGQAELRCNRERLRHGGHQVDLSVELVRDGAGD
jgi:hypothetical protein